MWECTRFAVIVMGVFGIGAHASGNYASIIWFASPQLVIAGLLLMIALYPVRYGRMITVVILAKVLAVVSGIVAAIPAVFRQVFREIGGLQLGSDASIILIVLLGDLIVLTALLLINRRRARA